MLDHNSDEHISLDEAKVAFGGLSSDTGKPGGEIWTAFLKRFSRIIVDKSKGIRFAEFEQAMRNILKKSANEIINEGQVEDEVFIGKAASN